MDNYGVHVQGTAAITAVGNTNVLAASGASKYYCIDKVIITIYGYADTGTISIDDGTTAFVGPILCKDGNGHSFEADFGPRGYMLGANLAVRLVNGTANVSARATIIGRLIG